MAPPAGTSRPTRILVLGGTRSGKSEFAEHLVSQLPATTVRYLATAYDDGTDGDWTARIDVHRARRPPEWTTVEAGGRPATLISAFNAAVAGEVLLVDDLGTWLAGALDHGRPAPAESPVPGPAEPGSTEPEPGPAEPGPTEPGPAGPGPAGPPVDMIKELAAAVERCAANVVLVSPEVGLALVPMTTVGRLFTDGLGLLNRAVADACHEVVLVVAGQTIHLKGSDASQPARSSSVAAVQPTAVPPVPPESTGAIADIEPGLSLPLPDDAAAEAARRYLDTLDLGVSVGAGLALGTLTNTVAFLAGAQGNAYPRPLLSLRVLLLKADHGGGIGAGPTPDIRHSIPLRQLAGNAGASLVTVELDRAAPIETEDALTMDGVRAALRAGWAEAERAADEGVELLVVAAGGTGAEAAATAVVAVATGAEATALLARIPTTAARYDDDAWMTRCAALRDALYRVRSRDGDPRTMLATLGGADIAAATGLMLGAASRRLPVMVDGPVGVAAALLARDFSFASKQWLLMPDHGDHPTVRLAADVLGLQPFMSLRLGLGEGTTSLAVLPLLQAALTLASSAPPGG